MNNRTKNVLIIIAFISIVIIVIMVAVHFKVIDTQRCNLISNICNNTNTSTINVRGINMTCKEIIQVCR